MGAEGLGGRSSGRLDLSFLPSALVARAPGLREDAEGAPVAVGAQRYLWVGGGKAFSARVRNQKATGPPGVRGGRRRPGPTPPPAEGARAPPRSAAGPSDGRGKSQPRLQGARDSIAPPAPRPPPPPKSQEESPDPARSLSRRVQDLRLRAAAFHDGQHGVPPGPEPRQSRTSAGSEAPLGLEGF